ncbi:actin binding protein [Blastocystis sp. subtype 4]|uniref:actin binding protein n=1 Tax=Blastocystis sp. subtype 4 TaxID=944170 RepID=UPI000711D234|nr:actin binding protein [Blastocystis sp. subtype 4]KNB45858.1 actin binding protein [Blastocystis sp. subtype 4]|eukprot:XP_014529301.1 actin binding protein [Blastocystis sp. subtype 4]
MNYTPASKFRHVYCPGLQPEEIYQGFRVASTTGDQTYIKGNAKYFAFPAAGGGGPILIRPHNTPGRMPSQLPLLTGHKGDLCDFDFNPFNDEQIISSSADLTVMLWEFPEGGPTYNIDHPLVTLTGHRRKVAFVEFNPVAELIAVSASADDTCKVWDCKQEEEIGTYDCKQLPQDLHWNYNGSLFCVSTKDKMDRIFDPRQNIVVQEWTPHEGTKCSKMVWIGDTQHIITTGFNRGSQREWKMWDLRNLKKPICSDSLDMSSGALLPFYDPDTSILFLAGKGDGNIRYYEVMESSLYPLSQYSSVVSARGLCMLPKKACDVNRCEVARIMKLTSKGDVEPLPFIVPRKFEGYQPDLYPPTFAGIPALSNEEWREGQNSNPYLMSLEPGASEITKKDDSGMPTTVVATAAPSNNTQPVATPSSAPVASGTTMAPVSVSPGAAMVPGRVVNGVTVPAPGYIPKAGDLTVEDIEAELALLMERMEFLNNALEKLKKN